VTRLSPVARVAAAAVTVVSVSAVAACSGSSKASTATTRPPTTVAGAAGTLRQAALAMEGASSYRFAGTVTTGGRTVNLSGEFSAPDRLHETITVAGAAPVERIVIGTSAYQRTGSSWRAAPGTATASDPRSTFTALAQATTVSQQGSVYRFTLAGAAAGSLVSGGSASGSVTGTASGSNNGITDLSFQSAAASGTTVRFTYSDIGTAPPVVAPKLTV
jgi:hypothetical protein